ncbi:MAG: two-component regulator propeller domain-containing protein, partial [Prevotella copri]|nr:two-component regulator propeller domain-containing protein [Segatella copri]
MKRTKVFYNALILLATLLLPACQERKNTPPDISSPEKDLVLSDHISNQKVMSICEDKYGQIWIGTFRGLNKYDGNQYHQYYCVDDSLGLPDNNITDI